MNDDNQVLKILEKELIAFIKKRSSFKHFLRDSFQDHKNRYAKDIELINSYYKGGRILDLGANPFHLTFCLKELGYDITGVDINPTPFKEFIQRYDLKVVEANIETEKLPFKDQFFDFIIFNEVFEHLRINPIFTLSEINRVLKKDGVLFLTTPNLYALHKILMFNMGLGFNDAFNEFNKLNIYGYMGHIREYSTKEVSNFLENTGFKIEKVIYRNDYSFFRYKGFKTIYAKLSGLIIDLLMKVNPYWSRHQAFIARKI